MPSLQSFKNINENNDYEDGYNSDGEIGPFFNAVVGENAMDKAYVKNLIDEAPPQEEITTVDVAQSVTEASTTSIITLTTTTVSNGCVCFD